ncbi:MAG: ribonuclease HI [Gammaproteobacteria bacterium TMED278]|jgi:ribonuclease HI|nr:ribonuclease HI [Gammaproteobacteria bacterium]OUX41822.1 MAG: ribonuclease HI [Gammaproteobacteria bacterium TMED278]RCL34618.1 MAG: ribonuclease HI [SAR86 cluster bacterium]URQ69084.1 ribonuclease HI [SAR86 cluster bacterium]|tara:strand:- start:59 stop:493 length:435 start_codon:yes stop_codon:yes gene_type:complete
MKTVNIYTDGACRGNPGPGGWGVLIQYQDNEKEYFGGNKNTTNNQMELQAAIEGLKLLKEVCIVNLTTDSKYVMQGITSWIKKWKINKWKNSNKKDVKNKELWIELDKLCMKHDVRWNWVKGHTGHEQNEIADILANKGIDSLE